MKVHGKAGSLVATSMMCAGFLNSQAIAAEKPNILIILTDDQGYAAVSQNPLHPKIVSTPNIDRIAKNGIEFRQAYVTGNVCSPTRAGLLTGRYQQRAQVYTAGEGGRGMSLDNLIIPTFLKPAGYVSGAFGKWHLGTELEHSPLSRGFDEFFGFLGRGGHDYFKFDGEEPLYRGKAPATAQGYLTDVLTDEAVAFIKHHKEQPFFCYLAYNAMHTPIQAPEETAAKYTRVKAMDPDYDEGGKRGSIVTYMAMLEHLDKGIGRVLDTLKAEGLEENTLIFFLTDNGGPFDIEQFNQPLTGGKHSNWEGGVRTPFFVSWPKRFKAGQTIDATVVSLDILPTLLEITGLPFPTDKPLDGKSLLPLIEGEVSTLHDALFWSNAYEGWWSARVGDWKLLGEKDKVQLFNLAKDPSEKQDLSGTNPEKLAELKKAYDVWLAEMPDPMTQGASKFWSPDAGDGKKEKKQKKIKNKGDE